MKFFEETEFIEMKKSTSELKEAVISIAAILNKHGAGELYFGIKNDGTPVGQEVSDKTLRDISRSIADHIEPKIYPEITAVKIDNKSCIRVKFEGNETPYFAYGRAYLRVADEDRQLTSKELQRIILAKAQNAIPWDAETPEKNPYSLDEIDEKLLMVYIERANTAGRIDFPFTNKGEILNKLKLMSGNLITNAANALFGSGAIDLQMAIFAGVERLTFIDIKRESGNIFKLIDTAELYIKNMIKWRVKFGKMQREEIPEIPMEAIREAIVNSFAHRDYRIKKSNEVAIFKDRVEVYNPGDFPEGYTPEDFIKGEERSILRNTLIAQILYFSKDIESWGSGLKRIYNLCKENDVKVEFKILKSGFVVVFQRPEFNKDKINSKDTIQNKPLNVGLNDGINVGLNGLKGTQESVLGIIRNHPRITEKEVAEQLGVKSRTIERIIKELREKGLIERKGSKKAGYWEVKNLTRTSGNH
ncbi:MAG: RNA-binding domain-containing protein [Bacillota bacterium]